MRGLLHTAWERWGFVLSRKWIGLFVLCCLFATACTFLALWQFSRHRDATAAAEKIHKNYDSPIKTFAENDEIFDAFNPETQWQRISVTGTYKVSGQRIVRNRPLNGQPGYEQLVPFRTVSGQTIIVDRGWLPIGDGSPGRPNDVPDPSARQVTLTVRIKPSEPPLGRDAPEGQLASIDLEGYADQLEYPIARGAYGLLVSENPPAASMPVALPRPNIGQGPHLSYGIQWLIFAALGFVGFSFGLYHAKAAMKITTGAMTDHGVDPVTVRKPGQPDERNLSGRRRRLSDEEAEDALLEAAGC